jgi:hypothetical protein
MSSGVTRYLSILNPLLVRSYIEYCSTSRAVSKIALERYLLLNAGQADAKPEATTLFPGPCYTGDFRKQAE